LIADELFLSKFCMRIQKYRFASSCSGSIQNWRDTKKRELKAPRTHALLFEDTKKIQYQEIPFWIFPELCMSRIRTMMEWITIIVSFLITGFLIIWFFSGA